MPLTHCHDKEAVPYEKACCMAAVHVRFSPFFLAGSLLACVLMAAWLLMLGGVAHLVHVVTARRRCNLARL